LSPSSSRGVNADSERGSDGTLMSTHVSGLSVVCEVALIDRELCFTPECREHK
jgi:hypothetical protein